MRAVLWFRNDLRLHDNTALVATAAHADELIPLFVFDAHLRSTVAASPTRSRFLRDCLAHLAAELERRGCPLVVRHGDPAQVIARLLADTRADVLAFNRDYTPYAKRRDAGVRAAAHAVGATVEEHADRLVFEPDQVRTRTGGGFVVYTPFRNAWLMRYRADPPLPAAVPRLPRPVAGVASDPLPPAPAPPTGSGPVAIPAGGEAAAQARLGAFLDGPLRHYARDRNRPAIDGTSRLSPYLRLGVVSLRSCVHEALARAARDRAATDGARKWVDELIWREFYLGLLDRHPHLLGGAFRRELDAVQWNDDPAGWRAWCAGRTGFPFVDAAMRQLAQCGWMHNRARMVVASFLTKDLLLDWRRGARWFMRHLVDGDPASNNGGWQWAASTGTDAQPYFRIFNPLLQGEKFDPDGAYVRRFVPELRHLPDRYVHRPWEAATPPPDYPPPIVDHAERRVAAIARYEAARARPKNDHR
jgi:deoxyribodipyrimidine photo-lyase